MNKMKYFYHKIKNRNNLGHKKLKFYQMNYYLKKRRYCEYFEVSVNEKMT